MTDARATTLPADLARRCFALAASTTFSGERDAAVARGMAIAEKHGLDLNDFDIPGRRRVTVTRELLRCSGCRRPFYSVDRRTHCYACVAPNSASERSARDASTKLCPHGHVESCIACMLDEPLPRRAPTTREQYRELKRQRRAAGA